jgi:hypothetical protein
VFSVYGAGIFGLFARAIGLLDKNQATSEFRKLNALILLYSAQCSDRSMGPQHSQYNVQRLMYVSLPIEGVWFIIAVLIAFGNCRATAKRAGVLDTAPEGSKIKIGLSWLNAESSASPPAAFAPIAPSGAPKVALGAAVQIAHRFFADAPVSATVDSLKHCSAADSARNQPETPPRTAVPCRAGAYSATSRIRQQYYQ